MTCKTYYNQDKTKRAWYDRNIRSWIMQHMDNEGNQIGCAEYCAHKQSAMSWLNS